MSPLCLSLFIHSSSQINETPLRFCLTLRYCDSTQSTTVGLKVPPTPGLATLFYSLRCVCARACVCAGARVCMRVCVPVSPLSLSLASVSLTHHVSSLSRCASPCCPAHPLSLSLRPDGAPDGFSLHAGCPPEGSGSKWAVNKCEWRGLSHSRC